MIDSKPEHIGDVLRRLERMEQRHDEHADMIGEIRVALAKISTSLDTMVSVLRWGPALVGVVSSGIIGIMWLIQHTR